MKVQKDKEGYHVVLTTYNSRTSPRMKRFNVKKGRPINLSLDQEITLTEIISRIIIDNNYHCLAYNICRDHLHLLIVCEYENLVRIIRRIKSVSARKYNIEVRNNFKESTVRGSMGQAPLERRAPVSTHMHLWSRGFFRADLNFWEPACLSSRSGYLYQQSYLENVLTYINNNRYKHNLPVSVQLRQIINSFVISQDVAFRVEWKDAE